MGNANCKERVVKLELYIKGSDYMLILEPVKQDLPNVVAQLKEAGESL